MSSILVVPVLPCRIDLTEALVDTLAMRFHSEIVLETTQSIDPSFAFDAYRNQHNSTALIAFMLSQFSLHNGKILGLTNVDLYIPVLTFVFGEAQLDGQAAVVSTRRLAEEFYGLPPNAGLAEERLMKEAIHELGHTYGLIHCADYECVMHSSTGVEEIDIKGSEFCPACRRKLEANRDAGVLRARD